MQINLNRLTGGRRHDSRDKSGQRSHSRTIPTLLERRGEVPFFVEKLTPGSASNKVLLHILPKRQETLALDEVLGINLKTPGRAQKNCLGALRQAENSI
jgi:hypothetical protein